MLFRSHGCYGPDPGWDSLDHWSHQALAALGGQGDLAHSLRWNAGTYLWQAGQASDLQAGIALAEHLLQDGAALRQLQRLSQHCSAPS